MSSPVPTSSSSSKSASKSQKRSRSRHGCSTCRKSKIKCDETKPVCTNCVKFGRKCDYSIQLTWGGRPYKVPKIEKLNPIASLSRIQLLSDTAKSSLIPDSNTVEVKVSRKTLNSSSQIKKNKDSLKKDSPTIQVLKFANIKPKNNSIPTDKKPSNIKPPSLNPSENLSFLLEMSDKNKTFPNLLKPKDPSKSKEKLKFDEDLPNSLEEVITPSQNTQAIPTNDVSTNIKTANTMLGSFFNDKITQLSPWSLLEEIDESINDNLKYFGSADSKLVADIHNNSIKGSHGIMNSQFLNSNEFETLQTLTNDSSNLSSFPQNSDLNFDDFAIDINKTNSFIESSTNHLFSTPMLNQSALIYNNNSNNSVLSIRSVSSTSSLSDNLEPIPRGLLPLPDMLLNVPYYYDSFLFYINSTSSILTPADDTVYKSNPFRMVLPKLAMTNKGIMSLVVAFGATHKSSLLKQDSTEIVDALLSRALSDLLVLLNNKDTCTSDLTLTIVLLFSSFLAFNFKSDKWRVHMSGAKQIFLMRGYNRPFDKLVSDFKTDGSLISGEIKKSKLLYFLIRWFAYIDIFSNLSTPLEPSEDEILKFCNSNNSNSPGFSNDSLFSPLSDLVSSPNSLTSPKIANVSSSSELNDSNNLSESNDRDIGSETTQIDYEVCETNEYLAKDESHKGIDYMLGFKIKFLPLFSKLCQLIKHVNLIKKVNEKFNSQTTTVGLSPKIIECAINLQAKFQKLKYTEYLDNSNSKSINVVIASNHCFLLMGLIQLYRRVLLMPRNSKVVQEMCIEILNTINTYIDTKEPTSLCVIFPLFVAGCECLNVSVRHSFIEKIHDLQERGSVSASVAAEIMLKCWETGQDWCEIILKENKVVVFL